MGLADIINNIFQTFNQQLIEPVVNGLWGLIPNTSVLMVLALLLGAIVCFSPMQRGQKIASLIALVVILFIIPYVPSIISTILSESPSDASTVAQSAADGLSNPAATLSNLE